MPIVRNVKTAYKYDHNVWIGGNVKDPHGNIIRKASPFAVPFELRVKNRNNVDERKAMLIAYKTWLWHKLNSKNDNVSLIYWNALRHINGHSVLLCYCESGERCHGEVVRDAWIWAHKQGLLDHVTTPHTSDKTLKTLSKAVVKETQQERVKAEAITHPDPATVYAEGPLNMASVLRELGKQYTQLSDARIDEELLEAHAIDCQCCQEQSNALHHGAPRKARGIVYSIADPLYNRLDEMEADLHELPPTARDSRGFLIAC